MGMGAPSPQKHLKHLQKQDYCFLGKEHMWVSGRGQKKNTQPLRKSKEKSFNT
ncbi:hypothetical protein I79_007474 [Cricetulus griseus]|uniref:Uncharacterized protein n=1 Tax=Cricetulus griseus TaxID=10029 RepID=G3HAL5_CRIGR|nr:hypothetical protein I79_007474 [Cricetulus griseus]